MADDGLGVVLPVPACRTWQFTAYGRTTTVGKTAKQALRIAERSGRGAGLDVVFYGRTAGRNREVAVSTRLEADRQAEWLRDWTYLPDTSVSLSKEPRKGAR